MAPRPTIASQAAIIASLEAKLATAQRGFAAADAATTAAKATGFAYAAMRFDACAAPLIIAANKLRQAWDSQPIWMLSLLPKVIKVPIETVFVAVEYYERNMAAIKREIRGEADPDAIQQAVGQTLISTLQGKD